MTKPPSIALRTEVSYVSLVLLKNKEIGETTKLTFNLIKDLHNKSDKEISIQTKPDLAKLLEVNVEYIISYRKLKKVRLNKIKQYVPISAGPEFLNVQGAEPSIFRNNAQLIKQLGLSPKLAKNSPKILIDSIFKGILSNDPSIKEFFIRELINWGALHKHLEKNHYDRLHDVLFSPNTNTNTLSALLEPRELLHKGIGIERLSKKVLIILKGMPVDFHRESTEPSLVLLALRFADKYDIGTWLLYARWTRSNIPSLAETALLKLASLDKKRALALAKQRITETKLSESTRRVIHRFISKLAN